MTLQEVIDRADILKPNSYSQNEKIWWLSCLDGTIYEEIISTHEGGEKVVFSGYDSKTLLNTQLLVPAPYDEIYIRYLEMQINYANGEFGKYNNSAKMYEEAYASFQRYYNRTHMPKGVKFKYFGEPNIKEYQAATSVAKVTIEEDK